MRKRDIFLQAVALVLALSVGILLGSRGCGPSPSAPEVVTQTVVRTLPPQIVYHCPPDAGSPDSGEPRGFASKAEVERSPSKKLPDAPPPITPRQRQRLLAWVRDQSADLDGCRTAAKETFRLAVTLDLDDEGRVTRVRLNTSRGDVPSNVQSCLRERMARWTPPADLIADRRSLVFGLTL